MGEKGEHKKVGLDYDEVLDYIGQFGTFQRRIFLWLSFASAAGGLAVVVFAFTGNVFYFKKSVFLEIFWNGKVDHCPI